MWQSLDMFAAHLDERHLRSLLAHVCRAAALSHRLAPPVRRHRLFAAVCVACCASARAAAWQLVRPRPPAAPQPKVLAIEHDGEAHPAAEWAQRDELLAAEEEAGRPRSDSGPAAGPEHDYTDGLHKHDSRFTFPGHEYGDHQKHLQHLAYQEHLQRVRDEA